MQPVAICGKDGAVAGLTAERCALAEPDASGRRRPLPIAGSRFELACDTVILAVGQAVVTDFLDGCAGVRLEDGQVKTDRDTGMTDRPGVFAGGDVAATGLFTAIEAVAAGRRAAAAIHNHLRGETLLPVWQQEQGAARPTTEGSPPSPWASACRWRWSTDAPPRRLARDLARLRRRRGRRRGRALSVVRRLRRLRLVRARLSVGRRRPGRPRVA